MEAIQTLNPADVWEMVQKAIVWLAGIGIVIDITPGIKVQPVRWLIKQLGNLMNHDMKEQLDQLQKEFDHIIDILAKYDKYIKDRKLTNGQVDVAHEYILEIYKECMRTNDFALSKPEEP